MSLIHKFAAVAVLLAASAAIPACTFSQMKTASNDLTAISPVAAQITTDTATPAQLAAIGKGCDGLDASAAGITPILRGGAKTTAALIANPGQAYCGQLKATGKLPAATDSNTVNWLAVLTTTLETVKALAPIAVALL